MSQKNARNVGCLEKLNSYIPYKTGQTIPESTDAFLKTKGCHAKY